MSGRKERPSSKKNSASDSSRRSTFFINGEGIDREVITTDICRYLGNDALVKPGVYKGQEGFYVAAYQPPTSEQLADLRADSQKWQEEQARRSDQSQGPYDQSTGEQEIRIHDAPQLRKASYESARVGFPITRLPSTNPNLASGYAYSTPNYANPNDPFGYQAKQFSPVNLDSPVPAGYGRDAPPSNYDYGPSLTSQFSFGTTGEASYDDTDIDIDPYEPTPGATSLSRPEPQQDQRGGRDRSPVDSGSQLHSKKRTRSAVGELPDMPATMNITVPEVDSQDKYEDTDEMSRQESDPGRDPQHLQALEQRETVDNNNSTIKLIKDVIIANAISEDQRFVVLCQVDWELAQYCKDELYDNMSLHRVLTITGSLESAQAAACEDYVRQTWGERGLKLLDGIVAGCDGDIIGIDTAYNEQILIKNLKSSVDGPENVEITAAGGLEEVVHTITFFAWFAATFRPPRAAGLTISRVNFEYDNQTVHNGSTTYGWFRLSLCSPKQDIGNLKADTSSGACWLPLFQEGVIAYGFPVAKREEGEGLEISFDLLRLFAGVKGSIEYEGVTIYVGPSRILFPTKILRDGVQWHYVESKDKQVMIDTLNTSKNRVRLQNISNLEMARVFVGSYKHALVYAGTQEGIKSSCISDSGTPKSTSRLELAKEFTLNGIAGLTTPGASIGLGAKIVLPRSLQVSLEGVRDYDNRLESASQRPILVYDLSAKSAWLVSELSMLLHMVHQYLSPKKLHARRQYGGDMSPWPSLPFAAPSADGGEEAYVVIRDYGHTPLYTRREDGKTQKFWNEIDTLLKVFSTIRTQDYIKKATTGWKFRKPRLQGWDFIDLVTKEETVFQRELSADNKKSSWWSLADADDMVVLFGRDFGQLIRPNLALFKPYEGWESIPCQAELLTASMPCVKRLASKCNTTNSCEKLTPELFWHTPTSRSCPENSGCTYGCFYVQELRNQGFFGASPPRPPRRRLYDNDAVIFGDIKYYHDAVRRKAL